MLIVLGRVVLELVTQHGRSLHQEFIVFFHECEGRILRYLLVGISFQYAFLKFIDIINALQEYFFKVPNRLSDSGI